MLLLFRILSRMGFRVFPVPESGRTALAIATRTSAELPWTLLSLQRSAAKQLPWSAVVSDDQAGWSDAQFRCCSASNNMVN